MYLNIETERLSIRPINLGDAAFILELVNSDGWLNFIGDRKLFTRSDAEKYIQKILDNSDDYYSVFELKETRKAIGVVTFMQRTNENYPDFGFAILPEFERNGYTHEAAQKYLNEIGKLKSNDKIVAFTNPKNQRSINLLEKLGFKFDGNFNKDNEIFSYYSFTNPE